jgi:hypothetical protein
MPSHRGQFGPGVAALLGGSSTSRTADRPDRRRPDQGNRLKVVVGKRGQNFFSRRVNKVKLRPPAALPGT